MAFALIANALATGNVSVAATTAALDTTGANLLIVVGTYGGTPTLSDSKGNTWVGLTAQAGSGAVRIWYVLSPTVGTGHTFSLQGTNAYPAIAVSAWSGSVASSGFDVQNGAVTAGATSILSGSITPSEDNELLIIGLGGVRTTTASVNVGTILNQTPFAAGVNYGVASAYQIQTTATARNATWSWTGSTANEAVIASFKAAAAGGGFVPIIGRGPGMALVGRGGLVG